MTNPRLTPEDWIAAAFRRLGAGGIGAVRAEVIARDLKVSKGSFYWHFKDLADLKARMLAHWEQEATARIIAMTTQGADQTPKDQIRQLLTLATSDLADPYGGLSTEAAIRDWARTDEQAARSQVRTDATRLAFLERLMTLSGGAGDHGARTARLILMTYTGALHMGVADRAVLLDDLMHLLDRLLSQKHPQ